MADSIDVSRLRRLHMAVNETRLALEQAIRDDIVADHEGAEGHICIQYEEEPRLPPVDVFDYGNVEAIVYVRGLVHEMQREVASWSHTGDRAAPAHDALIDALDEFDAALDDPRRSS